MHLTWPERPKTGHLPRAAGLPGCELARMIPAGCRPVLEAKQGDPTMAYKDMLVHVDSSAACVERLDVATRLARAFDAHLIGLYVAALAPIHQYAEADFGPDLVERMRAAFLAAHRQFAQTACPDIV